MSSAVARRYAEAVFAVAREENDYDGWRREITLLAELFQDDVLATPQPIANAVQRDTVAVHLVDDRVLEELSRLEQVVVLSL